MTHPTPSHPTLLLTALLALALITACDGCDGLENSTPDAGTFIEEDVHPPDIFNPTDPGDNNCEYGSGSGGSGSGGSSGTSGCDQPTPVDCSRDDCGSGTCVPGENGEPDRCACDTGFAGSFCATCAPGFVPQGLSCIPCSDDLCGAGRCAAPNEDTRLTCICDEGYTGSLCDSCASGWQADGTQCVPDNDGPCEPNPCTLPNQSICSPNPPDSPTPFSCSCDPGTTFDRGSCRIPCDSLEQHCQAAQPSTQTLSSANGHSTAVYDLQTRKTTALWEHAFQFWSPEAPTRDLLHDTYFGIRTEPNQPGLWLTDLEPTSTRVLDEAGIVHTVHNYSSLRFETFIFSTYQLARPSLAILLRVTNTTPNTRNLSIYSLHNWRLGSTSPQNPSYPNADNERASYNPSTHTFTESGPAGTTLHTALSPPSHASVTPDNPHDALLQGRDLNDTHQAPTGNDRVPGFQFNLSLAPNESKTVGILSAFERFDDLQALQNDLQTIQDTHTDPASFLRAERALWDSWRTPPPNHLSPSERAVYRRSEALLRQAQVLETSDLSHGQILAALAPSPRNIAWARHMAYSILALSRAQHFHEARSALHFILNAQSSLFHPQHVPSPYLVSTARYDGRGHEHSDTNHDGPNIEHDAHGLFLTALLDYTQRSGDTSLLETYQDTIFTHAADLIVDLIDPDTGLITPDSSIWEVHLNGNERSFAFTSLTSARGLCDAAQLALLLDDTHRADTYRTHAHNLLRSILHNLSPTSSSPLLPWPNAPTPHADISTLAAINLNLFDPNHPSSLSLTQHTSQSLRTPSSLGFARNSNTDPFNSREWPLASLFLTRTHLRQNNSQPQPLSWITAQALANYGDIAESHDPNTGTIHQHGPMIGYGAALYILSLFERSDLLDNQPSLQQPSCTLWAHQLSSD